MLVTLDTPTLIAENKLRENLDDLRFTWRNPNENVEYEIPYWVGPTPKRGLVGHWSFDEGEGNIAYDLSGFDSTIFAPWSG